MDATATNGNADATERQVEMDAGKHLDAALKTEAHTQTPQRERMAALPTIEFIGFAAEPPNYLSVRRFHLRLRATTMPPVRL
jgi:hypothetical protein